jgi:hypothetical protein
MLLHRFYSNRCKAYFPTNELDAIPEPFGLERKHVPFHGDRVMAAASLRSSEQHLARRDDGLARTEGSVEMSDMHHATSSA